MCSWQINDEECYVKPLLNLPSDFILLLYSICIYWAMFCGQLRRCRPIKLKISCRLITVHNEQVFLRRKEKSFERI